MKKISLVVSDVSATNSLFSKVSSILAAQVFAIDNVNAEMLCSSSVVVVDFASASGAQLAHLKGVLEQLTETVSIGCVDLSNRQQVVQAKAIGLSELLERDFDGLVVKLRALAGNYAISVLPEATPAATREAVVDCCNTMDQLALAAITQKPFPIRSVAMSVQSVMAVLQSDGMDNWLTAVQSHHSHTFCHSMLVAGYAVAFAKLLGLSEEEQTLLGLGALVHDVGKVRIPLAILDKPGKLTREEYALVKRHPVYSKEILDGRPEIFPAVRDIALQHHEFLDGTGYPEGLSGDQISHLVRITTICDIYSALTEKRSYKQSYAPRQAYGILFDMTEKVDQDLLRKFQPVIFKADVGAVKRRPRERVVR
ncbi:HD-GYP domain-containing protein [Roseibium algae]|uniref:HD-GYP domain-containing protein n=1 Tax=Roseibium algae TaxID=3123038 RepID=A0ABU8TEY3_9HYPH